MLKVKLVIIGGNAKTKEIRLQLPTTIGRGKEADLTIPHALVSRSHSKLFERDGQLYVKDLGSLNGTFVDKKRIESEQNIAPNQLLTLGDITFRAVYEIDMASRETLPDNRADFIPTLCSSPTDTEPPTPKAIIDCPSIPQSNTESIVDIAETSLHRSAISEIDSFDPDEVGSLDTPSVKVEAPQITPNEASRGSQQVIAESPINFISDELNSDQPIAQASAQASAIDIDLNVPDGESSSPVSFIAKIQTDDNSPSAIDDFQIKIDSDAPEVDIDNSQLGSFLKKFPK